MREQALTQAYLKSILHYDRESGIFTWISPPKEHPRLIGQVAGGKGSGYVMIKIDGVKYGAHRLAWLYETGKMPPSRIDHKDTDTLNNAFSNLRPATQAQNCANARKWAKKKLPKGVKANHGRYSARISFEKKLRHIGTFDTPEEAHAAYYAEARRLYGEFARAA
jgi:hypothetical protein